MPLKLKKKFALFFKIWLFSICLAILLTGRNSSAEVEPIQIVSGETTSFYEKISKTAILNYAATYRGSPLNDLTSAWQPTPSGDLDISSPQSIDNLLTLGYKIKPDWVVGGVAHFLYFPIGNPVGTGQNIQILDPMLLISKNNLVKSGGFTLNGKVTIYLPLTANDTLNRNRLATAISPTLTASYDIPGTQLTLAAYGFLRGYIPTSAAIDGALTYRLYFAPNLSYQMSNTVAATLWVDLLSASRCRGTPFIMGMETDTVDIQPGISWDVTRSINISPVLNIYPANPTLASTSIQLYASVKAF